MANIQNVALVDRGRVVTGGGSGGHTIINESGTSLAQEPNLQFKGADVSDDSTNNKTVVDMSYTEINYEDWLELTEQEKETGRWDVVGVPGADGTVSFDLMTKLWENSSPTQAMASGISIALSESVNNFDFLLAIFRFSTTVVNNFAVIGNIGVTLQSNVQAGGNNANRELTYTDSTHFTSGKGWSGSTEDSTKAIPLAIYGIKTSQTVEIKAIAPEVSTSASKCMMSDGETSVEDVITEIDNNTTIIVEETVSSIAVSTAWGGICSSSAIQIDISSIGFQNYPTVLSCMFEPETEYVAWTSISSISTTTIHVYLLRGSSGIVSGKIILQLKKEI